MTPLGQLVFFAQFLHAGGRWEDFCQEAPFGFTSPNAPTHADVLGSLLLSILCGHTRYAHVNALRFDTVTPPMLGMGKVVSEDSARRNLKKLELEQYNVLLEEQAFPFEEQAIKLHETNAARTAGTVPFMTMGNGVSAPV